MNALESKLVVGLLFIITAIIGKGMAGIELFFLFGACFFFWSAILAIKSK